jgi:hypothetical protein
MDLNLINVSIVIIAISYIIINVWSYAQIKHILTGMFVNQ